MSEFSREWNDLYMLLAENHLHDSRCFRNSFYSRLVTVLLDPNSTLGDMASAYRDALMGAPSDIDKKKGLPVFRLSQESNKHLTDFGVIITSTNIVNVIERGLVADDGSVDLNKIYAFKRVSRIEQFPMDPALKALFKDERYKSYNGRAQAAAVRLNLMAKENATTLVNLPTGTGKTLVAQALSMCSKNKLTLVIVPLTALAIDQGNRAAEMLNKQGNPGSSYYFWHGSQDPQQHQTIKSNIRNGRQTILFTSPEAACKSLLFPLFDAAKADLIDSIVIDEAHMVVEWGDDFRPYYQIFASLLSSLRKLAPKGIKCCLMTATLTEHSTKLLTDFFSDKESSISPIQVNGGFLRPEIQYHTLEVTRAEHKTVLLEAVRLLPKPLIVYVSYPKDASVIKRDIINMNFSRVGLFTGETTDQQKEYQLKCWNNNQLDIMVATSAFGMGVNKTDVRSVLHADMPPNINSFYQQVGRGGRDGRSCQSLVVWHSEQIPGARKLNNKKLISPELGRERWEVMWRLGRDGLNDYRLVDVKSMHPGVEMNSDWNESWNRQVLLSMQRSGMIQSQWPTPEPPEWDESLSDSGNKNALDKYYENYYGTLSISILADNHQQPETWVQYYGPQLEKERSQISESFGTIKNWLKNPTRTPLCSILEKSYGIYGHMPEKVCNGCPGCRSLQSPDLLPEVGGSCQIVNLVEPDGWTGALRGKNPDLNLHYSCKDEGAANSHKITTKKFVNTYYPWVRQLLESGAVKTVRADRDVLDQLSAKISREYKGFWIAIPIDYNDEFDPQWPELVLIMPEENTIPNIVSDLRFTPRLLVAPDTIISNKDNGTRWWEKKHHASSLKHFIAGSF